MPTKRAVLIGCNYPGTNAELKGCINDVVSMQEMLKTCYGFTDENMVIMIDTDPSSLQPTGKNIKAKFNEMVAQSVDGDELFIHFSGHGTQVPSDDPEEKDAKDEAICPCDMNIICDGDLRTIFMPLKNKPAVKLTFVADCCHSGTLLDHAEVVITGPKAGGPPPPSIDVQAIQSMLAALGGGNKEIDMKNRALPFSELINNVMDMLGKVMGKETANQVRSAVPEGQMASLLHMALGTMFGADASQKTTATTGYMQYAKMGMQLLQATGFLGGGQGAGGAGAKPAGASAGGAGALAALCGMCFGGGAGGGTGAGAAYATDQEAQAPAVAGGTGATLAKPDGPPPPKPPAPGAKPPADQQLPKDVGILITGCQDKETSADARPVGGPPHGALSNAIVTVIKNHHKANPGYPLTYRNLVIGVREMLAKTGFAQNPCLECSDRWADDGIVVQAVPA